MDIFGTKTFGEKEDEEVERLVRPLPKKKPPRKDRRREEMRTDRDPDVDGDSDLKGDPDLSMNYKTIGGSMVDRVARRFLARKPDMISVRHRETGRVVQVSEETLKEEGGKYEKLEEEAQGDPKGDALRDLAKDKPQLQSILKDLTNPKSDLGGLAEGNPDLPASTVLRGVQLPEGIKTLGDAVKALRAKPSPKSKPKKAPKQEPSEAPKEEAPKEEAPKEEAPKEEAPKEEAPKEEAPKEEAPKEEAPKEEAPKARDPRSIKPPTRPAPKPEEVARARDQLLNTLPPALAVKFFNLHPADVKTLVRSYKSFKGVAPKDLDSVISSAGLGGYTTDPSKVNTFPKALQDPNHKVPETEQAELMQQHRMAAVGASLVLRAQASGKLTKNGVPEHLAPRLAEVALTMASTKPEERDRVAKKAARELFIEASSGRLGFSERPVDERFGVSPRGSTPSLLSGRQRSKLLESIKELDPHTQMVAVAHLQGEDVRAVRQRYLSGSSPDRISEKDSPSKIASKLAEASHAIAKAGRDYPKEVRSALDDPGMVFRIRVMNQLQKLDPAKAVQVQELLKKADAERYEKSLKAFERESEKHAESFKKFERKHRAWQEARSKHEAEVAEGGPYRSAPKPFKIPEPKPPVAPTPPIPPPGYEPKPSKKERQQAKGQFEEALGVRVASLYSSYGCRKWQMGAPMSSVDQLRQAVRTAIYHGVQPYPAGHEGFAVYPEWHQVHQRDLGPNDFGVILKAAQDWLKSPVLSTAVEGMVPDARFRAALDLAIQNSEDGKYNRAIHPALYNMLLAKLSDQPEEGTLLTVREAKTAGFSYAVDTIQVLFVSARKPVPFNIDIINAINRTWVSTEGDDGEEHEVNLKVVDTRGGGFLTFHQEKAGYRVETLVWVQVPESDIDKAFKALQDVGKKHGFKVEKAHSGTKPGVRKVSSTEETAEGNVMTVKFAKSDANKILGRLDKIAGHIQENYAKWGMDFETAKGIVNDLDRTADEIEKAAFGEDSLASRQVELLKSAKVIQQDSDEGYMGTYNAPTAPHQTDSDEPYMGLYKDDQTQGVQTGKSTTGRPLAP